MPPRVKAPRDAPEIDESHDEPPNVRLKTELHGASVWAAKALGEEGDPEGERSAWALLRARLRATGDDTGGADQRG